MLGMWIAWHVDTSTTTLSYLVNNTLKWSICEVREEAVLILQKVIYLRLQFLFYPLSSIVDNVTF